MDDVEVLHVPEGGQQLDGEPADEAVLKALVVIHLNEFIQIDGVEVKHNAQMVSPHEVVLKLNNALNVFWVVLLEQQQQFGFHGRLVVVFLLILNKLDGNLVAVFVIYTFDDLPEGALANQLNVLEAVRYLISINYSIIPFLVVKTVINQSFQFSGLVLLVIRGQVVNVLEFLYLRLLE